MLRAAIIGLGSIAPVHLEAIPAKGKAKLVAACDNNPDRRGLVPREIPFYESYEEMLTQERPDVVHICLPHYLHAPVAAAAAAMGCHVLLEKPVARTVQEAETLLPLEERYGVRIGVCFQNRYNATSEALRQALLEERCGKIIGLRGLVHWYRSDSYYRQSPWRASMELAGGGCMINQSIHTLDLLQWLAGSPMTQIQGQVGNLLDYGLEVEDTASLHIHFENGSRAFFQATNACYQDLDVELDVQCAEGSYRLREKKLYEIRGEERLLAVDSAGSVGKDCYGSSHAKLIDRFYDTLLGTGQDYVTVREAIPSLRMMEAARQSSRIGAPVPVSDDKKENGT